MRIYDSFDELFTILQPRLVNYAVRFTGDPAAARDLVQDAYISLWEKYGRKDSRQAPSLLYTIVRNKCLNYLKRRKILENLDPDIPDDAATLYDFDLSGSPFGESLQEEYKKDLDRLIDNLPDRCREVFFLSRFKGLKNREIAEKLGISLTAVEKSIRRALGIFKNKLKNN